MALANLCVASSFGAFFLFPLFILGRGGTEADIGIVMGIFALASTLCRPLVAEGIDRIGRKRAFTAGSLLMTAIPLGYLPMNGVLESFYAPLLALRVAHGIGLALCFTAAFTFVADLIPHERLNEGIGMFGISGLSGMAVGPVIGEAALHGAGFTGLFTTAAALGALGLALHLPLKDTFMRPSADEQKTTFFTLLRQRPVLVAALLSLLFGFGLAAPQNFVAPLAQSRQIPFVSLFFIAYAAAAIITRLFGGRLADRIGEKRILPYALGTTGAGIAVLALVGDQISLTVAGFLTGCGHGLLFPTLSVLSLRGQPAGVRGRITGIYTGAIDGGTFAGSFLLGWVGTRAGLSVIFATGGAALFFGLGLVRLAGARKDKRPPTVNHP